MQDFSFHHALHGFAQPLETWSKLHRLSLALGIAWLAFTASSYLWTAAQTVSHATRYSEIAKLTARVQSAKASLAALPSLRQRAKTLETQSTKDDTLLDDVRLWQILATAVANNGLTFERFAPGNIVAQADWRERSLKLQINGTFAGLASFAAHLTQLPFPVIPISVQLNPQKNGLLSLEAVLRVIGMPHQIEIPSTSNTALEKWSNPFQEERTAPLAMVINPAPLTPWQLIGILEHGAERTALIQSANNFLLLQVGDVLDGEVVTRIEESALFLTNLTNRQASRTLSMRKRAP